MIKKNQVCVPDLVRTNCEDEPPSMEVATQAEEEKLKKEEVKHINKIISYHISYIISNYINKIINA